MLFDAYISTDIYSYVLFRLCRSLTTQEANPSWRPSLNVVFYFRMLIPLTFDTDWKYDDASLYAYWSSIVCIFIVSHSVSYNNVLRILRWKYCLIIRAVSFLISICILYTLTHNIIATHNPAYSTHALYSTIICLYCEFVGLTFCCVDSRMCP